MTNEEKYKTAEERQEAFCAFCRPKMCYECPCYKRINGNKRPHCILRWLALEAEGEKLMPCPFCGGEAEVFSSPYYHKRFAVRCNDNRCDVRPCTEYAKDINDAIAAWNRRAE